MRLTVCKQPCVAFKPSVFRHAANLVVLRRGTNCLIVSRPSLCSLKKASLQANRSMFDTWKHLQIVLAPIAIHAIRTPPLWIAARFRLRRRRAVSGCQRSTCTSWICQNNRRMRDYFSPSEGFWLDSRFGSSSLTFQFNLFHRKLSQCVSISLLLLSFFPFFFFFACLLLCVWCNSLCDGILFCFWIRKKKTEPYRFKLVLTQPEFLIGIQRRIIVRKSVFLWYFIHDMTSRGGLVCILGLRHKAVINLLFLAR